MQKIVGKYSFNMNHLIGKGAYGTVYKGISNDGLPVAIKVIDRRMINQTNTQQLLNEIRSMKQLNHKNIVKFLDFYETQNNFYIISEFCNGGDLRDIIKRGKLDSKSVVNILKQILNGYHQLYQNSLIHRDLKPANILLHQGITKLADFGFAKKIDFENDLMTSIAGTPLYMAPQVILRQPYTSKCDIWSLGMVLYELLFQKPPINAENIIQLQERICKPIIVPQLDNSQLQQLIQGCLQIHEENRINWDEIYQNPLIQEQQQQENTKRQYAGILEEVEPDQTDYRKFLITNYLQIEFEANQRIYLNQLNFARSAFNFSFFIQQFEQSFQDLAQNLRWFSFNWLQQLENSKFLKEQQKFFNDERGLYCITQLKQMKQAFIDNCPENYQSLAFDMMKLLSILEEHQTNLSANLGTLNRHQLLATYMIKYLNKTLRTARLNECFYVADLQDIQKFPDKEIMQRILEF
ncbi:unnamed protein product (macronuclear) [Paramecium tetraurelia]|uniref:non-specific serine/threonine protein kinase n=1 Tax=Paramecium tetraurelia TaxID=5888 RepID=A0BJ35_PARTE|nr:uncharacterized protein GSPATT00004925001 [Paramecium tetraurelia]CAK58552.1 unnamed protein product [Paramecium tetraurelia]|eukprot:XP_001425950.1 hypothetical protein (macronuclear) [Paramecium tetraurelia strain d4-2]